MPTPCLSFFLLRFGFGYGIDCGFSFYNVAFVENIYFNLFFFSFFFLNYFLFFRKWKEILPSPLPSTQQKRAERW